MDIRSALFVSINDDLVGKPRDSTVVLIDSRCGIVFLFFYFLRFQDPNDVPDRVLVWSLGRGRGDVAEYVRPNPHGILDLQVRQQILDNVTLVKSIRVIHQHHDSVTFVLDRDPEVFVEIV